MVNRGVDGWMDGWLASLRGVGRAHGDEKEGGQSIECVARLGMEEAPMMGPRPVLRTMEIHEWNLLECSF